MYVCSGSFHIQAYFWNKLIVNYSSSGYFQGKRKETLLRYIIDYFSSYFELLYFSPSILHFCVKVDFLL